MQEQESGVQMKRGLSCRLPPKEVLVGSDSHTVDSSVYYTSMNNSSNRVKCHEMECSRATSPSRECTLTTDAEGTRLYMMACEIGYRLLSVSPSSRGRHEISRVTHGVTEPIFPVPHYERGVFCHQVHW